MKTLYILLILTFFCSCRKCTECTGTWVSSSQPYASEFCGSSKKVQSFEESAASDSTIIKNVNCARTK